MKGHIVSELCVALVLFFVAGTMLATCIGVVSAKPSKADIKCEANVPHASRCCLATNSSGDCVRWGIKECTGTLCGDQWSNVRCGACQAL